MDKAAYDRTAKIAQKFKVIKKPRARTRTAPTSRRTPSTRSRAEGVDVNGDDWKKPTVKVTAGGA